jgi:DNA-binding NtrC family response regulator
VAPTLANPGGKQMSVAVAVVEPPIGIIARTQETQSLFQTVRRLADAAVPVLIEGESGV